MEYAFSHIHLKALSFKLQPHLSQLSIALQMPPISENYINKLNVQSRELQFDWSIVEQIRKKSK